MRATYKQRKKHKYSTRDFLFYCLLLAFPIIQFSVMYIGVNFNSIIMSFKQYEVNNGVASANIVWTFDNIRNVISWFFGGDPEWTAVSSAVKSISFWTLMKNSVLSWLIVTAVTIPLGLFFAYYIFKKHIFSGFFRVMLFLPSILSVFVLCGIFNWFDFGLIESIKAHTDYNGVQFLMNPKTQYITVILFNIWLGFGVSVLLYTNKMASISPDIIEAAKLDGVTEWQEFTRIVLPQAYSTLSVFLITGFSSIFINQYNLFSFFDTGQATNENLATFGYWFYSNVWDKADQMKPSAGLFPLAAIGLGLTFIAVPITLLIRHLLTKYGPSEE